MLENKLDFSFFILLILFFFFKQKTAYEIYQCDWSSDVCSSDLDAGLKQKLVGLVLEGKGVLRNHQKVIVDGLEAGEVTSGSFSPSLNHAIAFARVPVDIGARCKVDIRGRQIDARVVKPPFVRNGKSCIE